MHFFFIFVFNLRDFSIWQTKVQTFAISLHNALTVEVTLLVPGSNCYLTHSFQVHPKSEKFFVEATWDNEHPDADDCFLSCCSVAGGRLHHHCHFVHPVWKNTPLSRCLTPRILYHFPDALAFLLRNWGSQSLFAFYFICLHAVSYLLVEKYKTMAMKLDFSSFQECQDDTDQ